MEVVQRGLERALEFHGTEHRREGAPVVSREETESTRKSPELSSECQRRHTGEKGAMAG